jgi:hypothetical protein
MKIATVAWPVGSLVAVVAAGLTTAALVVTHARSRPVSEASAPIYIPTPVSAIADPDDVPGDARYWAIDLDGDGQPELVAETADRAAAVVVRAYARAPIAKISLRSPGNPCQSELAIEDGRLVAHDYTGADCHEDTTRKFRIRDGQLATVTVWPVRLTIVDN